MTRGLSEKEKIVLEKRESGTPLKELAKEMGTTKEIIRQLEAKARRKTRKQKEVRFLMRFSSDEIQMLREQSGRRGLTASAYIRMLLHQQAEKEPQK